MAKGGKPRAAGKKAQVAGKAPVRGPSLKKWFKDLGIRSNKIKLTLITSLCIKLEHSYQNKAGKGIRKIVKS
jgi:hypothetical protein